MNTDHFTCHWLDASPICLDVELRNLHDDLLAGKNIPAWKGQENSFSPWVVTGHFLSDEQQCPLCLSKMTEHISAPVFAPPQLQGQGTSGLKAMTTIAQAWAETGRSPLTPSHHISSQICCSWDPTNTTRNGTKHLGMSEVQPGPCSSTCTDTSPGCWHMTREKAFLLAQEGTTAASEVPGSLSLLVMWAQNLSTCPTCFLLLSCLASFLFLLTAVFQAETKACSQSYKEPTVILFASSNCISTLHLPFWAVYS